MQPACDRERFVPVLGFRRVLIYLPTPAPSRLRICPTSSMACTNASALADGTRYSISTSTGPASRSNGKASSSSGSCRGRRSGDSPREGGSADGARGSKHQHTGHQVRRLQTRGICDVAPDRAANGHTAEDDRLIDGEYSRLDPICRRHLDRDVERRQGTEPGESRKRQCSQHGNDECRHQPDGQHGPAKGGRQPGHRDWRTERWRSSGTRKAPARAPMPNEPNARP